MSDEKKRTRRKDIGIKIWKLYAKKRRDLSLNGRKKDTKLDYESVALLYIK